MLSRLLGMVLGVLLVGMVAWVFLFALQSEGPLPSNLKGWAQVTQAALGLKQEKENKSGRQQRELKKDNASQREGTSEQEAKVEETASSLTSRSKNASIKIFGQKAKQGNKTRQEHAFSSNASEQAGNQTNATIIRPKANTTLSNKTAQGADAEGTTQGLAANQTESMAGLSQIETGSRNNSNASFEKGLSSWQVFWKPFQLRSSAQGFADKLSSMTAIDIQVRKQVSNGYQVAFPYKDEQDKRQKVQIIERETGMDLSLGAEK